MNAGSLTTFRWLYDALWRQLQNRRVLEGETLALPVFVRATGVQGVLPWGAAGEGASTMLLIQVA